MSELTTWAGRTLHGSDQYGEWVTTSSTWDDTPDPKGETEDIPNADGELDLPIHYAARFITITGHLHTRGHDEMHDAMHFFNGAKAGRLVVAGHGPTLWADAKRDSGTRFTPITDTFAQWQVKLKAPNPRKYGTTETFTVATGAPITAFHAGNYDATPRFTITGSMPGGYTITLNGWDYTVTVPLTSGSPHVIDYRDGQLLRNGVIVQNSLGNTNTTTVPPGPGVGVGLYPRTTGSGSAAMEVTDTYI